MRGLPSTLARGYYPLADGAEARPSWFFSREPGTGGWRRAAGSLAISVNTKRVWEITQNDLFIRSHDAAASISPLSLSRVTPPTADGQETRIDLLEGSTVVGRLASYRQSATKRGWKLYGYDSAAGGLQPAALTVTAEGAVSFGSSLNLAQVEVNDTDGDGILLSNALAGPTWIKFGDRTTPAGADTRWGMLDFLGRGLGDWPVAPGTGGAVGDLALRTSGHEPPGTSGRIVLAPADVPGLWVDEFGRVSLDTAPNLGNASLYVLQRSIINGGGLTLAQGGPPGSPMLDLFTNLNGEPILARRAGAQTGAAWRITSAGALVPGLGIAGNSAIVYPNLGGQTSDVTQDIGDGANRIRSAFIYALTLAGTTTPTHLLQLASDDAFKPLTSTWGIVSDQRTKRARSIRPYTEGLARVRQLQPIHYRTNGLYGTPKDADGVGFRAEHLAEVAPSMVSEQSFHKDEGCADGCDSPDRLLTVNLHELPLMLLVAVQELDAQLQAHLATCPS